jgi:hypothetical protein
MASLAPTPKKPVLRALILVLVAANLLVLGLRLWPWSKIPELPGNGATGIDPVVTLVGYIALAFWIGSARGAVSRRQLYASGWVGFFGGLLLAVQVYLASQPAEELAHSKAQLGLMAVTATLWGVCGARAVRAGCTKGFAAVSAVWAAAVSSLMASLAQLAGSFYSLSPGQTADAWKQYQGRALGSDEMQALVHTLLTATGYLLIGPVVACAVGAIFGAMAKPAEGKS